MASVQVQQNGRIINVPKDVWDTIKDFELESAPKSIKNLARSVGLEVGKIIQYKPPPQYTKVVYTSPQGATIVMSPDEWTAHQAQTQAQLGDMQGSLVGSVQQVSVPKGAEVVAVRNEQGTKDLMAYETKAPTEAEKQAELQRVVTDAGYDYNMGVSTAEGEVFPLSPNIARTQDLQRAGFVRDPRQYYRTEPVYVYGRQVGVQPKQPSYKEDYIVVKKDMSQRDIFAPTPVGSKMEQAVNNPYLAAQMPGASGARDIYPGMASVKTTQPLTQDYIRYQERVGLQPYQSEGFAGAWGRAYLQPLKHLEADPKDNLPMQFTKGFGYAFASLPALPLLAYEGAKGYQSFKSSIPTPKAIQQNIRADPLGSAVGSTAFVAAAGSKVIGKAWDYASTTPGHFAGGLVAYSLLPTPKVKMPGFVSSGIAKVKHAVRVPHLSRVPVNPEFASRVADVKAAVPKVVSDRVNLYRGSITGKNYIGSIGKGTYDAIKTGKIAAAKKWQLTWSKVPVKYQVDKLQGVLVTKARGVSSKTWDFGGIRQKTQGIIRSKATVKPLTKPQVRTYVNQPRLPKSINLKLIGEQGASSMSISSHTMPFGYKVGQVSRYIRTSELWQPFKKAAAKAAKPAVIKPSGGGTPFSFAKPSATTVHKAVAAGKHMTLTTAKEATKSVTKQRYAPTYAIKPVAYAPLSPAPAALVFADTEQTYLTRPATKPAVSVKPVSRPAVMFKPLDTTKTSYVSAQQYRPATKTKPLSQPALKMAYAPAVNTMPRTDIKTKPAVGSRAATRPAVRSRPIQRQRTTKPSYFDTTRPRTPTLRLPRGKDSTEDKKRRRRGAYGYGYGGIKINPVVTTPTELVNVFKRIGGKK